MLLSSRAAITYGYLDRPSKIRQSTSLLFGTETLVEATMSIVPWKIVIRALSDKPLKHGPRWEIPSTFHLFKRVMTREYP